METTPTPTVSSTTASTTIATSKRVKCGFLALLGLPGAAFCAAVAIGAPLSAITGDGASLLRAVIVFSLFGALFVSYSIYAFKGVRNASVARSGIAAAIGGVVFIASLIYGLCILPQV